ncbi:unnamed protein product [Rotaria sp. Silwood2]|nr:unnamed protein product [Rotaria sp. Silwood2]
MEEVSTFEMLPDEMILVVCQYLRDAEILYSFFNLNARLNSTIADFCHYVNIKGVTCKQFEIVTTQIVPEINLSIRSFVFDGLWENTLFNTHYPTLFQSKLSLLFPQLHTLSLVNFVNEQLNLFLDKITDLSQLVKLDIRNLLNDHTEELLKKVLAANNNQLKFVSFGYDSNDFILTTTSNDQAVSYPNIEELIMHLKTDKTLEHLFTLIPHINRLHIQFDQLSSTSKSTLTNVSSLVHLKDFQLRSINLHWSLDEIAYILSQMPSLQRLALDLRTKDPCLVNGQNFIQILPPSLIEIHLFIIYYFTESPVEVDTLLSTWSPHIRMTCLLDKSNEYAVIHTIPCGLSSIIIPATIDNSMMVGWEYTRIVTNLKIYGEQCSTDVHLIVQHFHRLRKLTIGSEYNSKAFQAAPNLRSLSIDLNCLNTALDDVCTCELLQQRIEYLKISHFREIDSIQLDTIAQKFKHLRDLGLSLDDSSIIVDSLILKVLLLWKDKNLRSLYIYGSVTDEVSKNLRQWLINHSHLRQEDSFCVGYVINWFLIWLP